MNGKSLTVCVGKKHMDTTEPFLTDSEFQVFSHRQSVRRSKVAEKCEGDLRAIIAGILIAGFVCSCASKDEGPGVDEVRYPPPIVHDDGGKTTVPLPPTPISEVRVKIFPHDGRYSVPGARAIRHSLFTFFEERLRYLQFRPSR